MITLGDETPFDVRARDALLDRAFGPCRFAKTSERLRRGQRPAAGLALVARDGREVVGTLRLWPVEAGAERPVLLLGPLAVDPDRQGAGIGGALMHEALRRAGDDGHAAVLLVGDPAYYGRFGFSADKTGGLWLPGPVERERFLGHELARGALDGAHGLVTTAGARTGALVGGPPAQLPRAA